MRRVVSRHGIAAAALVGAIASASPTFAQPSADQTSQATQFFDKGTSLYKQSRWTEAEVQFQKAWDLRRSFDVAANLGDCELEIGQHREAAEHLAFAMREFPLTGKPALRNRLAQRLAVARAQVGTFEIRVSEPGAQVSIDGRSVGLAPINEEVFVDPGTHTVEAKLGDYETGRATVEVVKGASKRVVIALVKRVDQRSGGAEGPNKAVIIGGAAVTGVALLTGAVLAIVATGKGSDADSKLEELRQAGGGCKANASACQTIDSDLATRDKLSNASMGVFIGAGAVGAATLAYALFAPRGRAATSGLRIVPTVGVGQGGVVMTGAW